MPNPPDPLTAHSQLAAGQSGGGLVELMRETRAERAVWIDDNLPANGEVSYWRWEMQVLPH